MYKKKLRLSTVSRKKGTLERGAYLNSYDSADRLIERISQNSRKAWYLELQYLYWQPRLPKPYPHN